MDSHPDQTSARRVKKSRRELVEEDILDKFHQSQRLQGILKRQKQQADDPEGENQLAVEDDFGGIATQEEAEAPKLSVQEQTEADQVLSDVNQLRKEKKKKLSKEKKQFKQQQKALKKQQQTIEEEGKEGKPEKALAYLKQWKRHREEWKFKKNTHIWLLKNWKHSSKLPDKRFKTFLKYLKSTEQKSLALQRLEKEAKSIVESIAEDTTTETVPDPNPSYDRARSVLQWIV